MKLNFARAPLFRLSAILFLLTGLAACTMTTSYTIGADERAWMGQKIKPIIKTEPAKAAAMVTARMKSVCLTDEVKVGTSSFKQLLAGTSKADHADACVYLNIVATYAYWLNAVATHSTGSDAGGMLKLQQHVNQTFFDSAARYQRRGWRHYSQISCAVFYPSTVLVLDALNIQTSQREEWERYKMPPWYDMQALASPADARISNLMHKHYLCRLDSPYITTPEEREQMKAKFTADVLSAYGQTAADNVGRYLREIDEPLLVTRKRLQPFDSSRPAHHHAQLIVLYENALRHLSVTGLDRVTYDGDAVFANHLRSRLSSEQESFNLYAR